MSFQINTNVNALDILRNLNNTSMAMSQSVQRLSSGLRINSGADDPSGLIASNTYSAQVAGLTQASRNVQDATNFAKTAESGLSEISTLLSSARALAVANGDASLDTNSKQANQAEFNSIMASVDRIGNTTQYGTKALLNGSSGASASIVQAQNISAINFQGVFNGGALAASGNVSVTMGTASTQATVTSTATYTAGTVLVGAGTFTVNGATFTTSAASTANDVVNMVNSATGTTGVTAKLSAANKLVLSNVAYGSTSGVTASDSFGLLAGGGAASASSATGVDAVANVTIGATTVSFAKGVGLQLKDADGNTIQLTAAGNASAGAQTMGYVTVNASNTFQIGANSGQTSALTLGDYRSAALGVNGLDIVNAASTAITSIDTAIAQVSNASARIGSFITDTLASQGRTLATATENMQAANSTIRDVDVAAEMTNFTRLQILQQSGVSILAQANQGNQSILKLLG